MYLDLPDEVEATLRPVVFARSAPNSRVVIAYQAPDLVYDVTRHPASSSPGSA